MIDVLSTVLTLGLASPAPPLPPPPANGFHVEAAPRMDPVFDDVASLRRAIDQFFGLQGEMEQTRDAFSAAVHQTLASLGPIGAQPAQSCPSAIAPLYGRAATEGRRFLKLGRRLAQRSKDIRRADELGDTVGLTPDYRIKAKKARELYLALLRDYREMRAAFYDQLTAEMRHAGCSLSGTEASGGSAPRGPDPTNASDWVLDPAADDDAPTAAGKPPSAPTPVVAAAPPPGAGPAIWIEIDNTRCARPSSFTLDGQPVAPIPAAKKVQIRTRAGPHALCVLPATEKRACGATGTVRQVYLFEGWSMAVRCTK